MFEKLIFAVGLALVFSACGNEVPEAKNPIPVGDQTTVGTEDSIATENLKAKGVSEDDLHGQAKSSLAFLQDELNKASGTVPGIGQATVLLDDNLMMIIRNEKDGKLEETKVNLKNLNPDPKSLQVFLEGTKSEFPGFRMFTLEEKPTVEVSSGGSSSRQNYIEFFLSNRSAVERALSGLMQAVRSAQGSGLPQ